MQNLVRMEWEYGTKSLEQKFRIFFDIANMEVVGTVLADISTTRLYKASDNEGGGWVGSGTGPLRVQLIEEGKYAGWGHIKYHNSLTGACGLSILVLPDMYLESSEDRNIRNENHKWRVTFKALSNTFGCNGKKNMYTIAFSSEQDAKSFFYHCQLLKFAAKQANVGQSIAISNNNKTGTDENTPNNQQQNRIATTEHQQVQRDDGGDTDSDEGSTEEFESQDWFAAFTTAT
eukprot:scaffold1580_cov116-Cylindrotheca_fusiformis.AAC.4